MIELSLAKQEDDFVFSNDIKSFTKPVVFFKTNKNDSRNLFLTFVIFDACRGKITYLTSYNKENIDSINNHPEHEKFAIKLVPHCTIEINKGIDFLVIMQEEQFFMHVNQQTCKLMFITMKDLIPANIHFKIISSTFYKDDSDNMFFYLAANDINNQLYIYRVSLDLTKIELIDLFPGRNIPPHVVRKYKNSILLSHEFNESTYFSKRKNKILSSIDMGKILVKNKSKIRLENPILDNFALNLKLFKFIKEQYDIKCVKGNIILLDCISKERITYTASGGSPAHFEIDPYTNMIYISSHNFFNRLDSISMFEPAVIDKYEYVNNRLEFRASFSTDMGFRYASHRVFYYQKKSFICTFGQPNRLIFIDADSMTLHSYFDIEKDELSGIDIDLSIYLNSRSKGDELVALEVSQNGGYIFFLDNDYIYIFDFAKQCIHQKIDYTPKDRSDWEDYVLRTLHVMYLQ